MDESGEIITGISDDSLQEWFQSFLPEDGFDLYLAEDERDLIERLVREPLCVVLLSDEFGSSGTSELLSNLEEVETTTFVILILQDRDEGYIHDKIRQGVDDFLVLPVNEELVSLRLQLAQEDLQSKHMDNVYSTALEKRVNQRTQQLWDNIRNIRQQFVNTVHALCQALYAKHPYTEGHSWRVAKVSERIAYAMDINGKDLENIRLGALFHDIGKIGIRDQILEKPGRLTDQEYNSVKEHPIIAEEILSPMEEFSEVVDIIKYEHENHDGSGYPYGISGEDIPLGARIVRIADTYDAIVTTRAYQEGETHLEAIDEIREASGSEFCPKVTRYFLALFSEDEGGLPESERKQLLGARYESVTKASRDGLESKDEFFHDLKEETDEEVVVIGDHSA